jgi:hypothetical protein
MKRVMKRTLWASDAADEMDVVGEKREEARTMAPPGISRMVRAHIIEVHTPHILLQLHKGDGRT